MSDTNGAAVSYSQDGNKLAIKISEAAANPIDVIIKIELAEPWNTDAVVPVEVDKGWFHPQPGFGVKQ